MGAARASPPSVRATLSVVAAAVALAYLSVAHLWPAVTTVVLAGAVYYLFAPPVTFLARRRVPRVVSTLVVIVLMASATTLALMRIVPSVLAEAQDLLAMLPAYGDRVERFLVDRALIGPGADPRLQGMFAILRERAVGLGVSAVNWLLGAVVGAFGSAAFVLLGVITGFYLLIGGVRIAESLPGWIPPAHRARWVRFGRAASLVLAGYLRARVLASIFIGVSYYIAFALLGLEQALLLAAIGGVMNMVPVIGPLLAAVPAVTIAAFQSVTLALAVAAVKIVAQQIESSVIAPQLEGHYLRIPAAVVVPIVAVGAALAGIGGMVLAVPVAGVARVALDIFYRERFTES